MRADGTILCLCTANVCRSPLLAAALTRRLGPGVEVLSAGTRATPEWTVTPATLAAARAVDLDLVGHRPARPDVELVGRADLVVTATREQRSEAARLLPRAARKAFTLHQLLRLTDAVTPDDLHRAHALVTAGSSPVAATAAMLGGLRGHVAPPAAPADDDLADPYGGSAAVQARFARQVVEHADRFAVLLDAVLAHERGVAV